MRLSFLVVCVFALVGAPAVRAAAQANDPAVLAGLESCVTHGLDSGVRAWYPEQPELGTEMSAKVVSAAARLGTIIDTEVVAVQSVSKRVTRFYVAVYFTRSPLWIRLDKYESRERSFFMPLKFSTNPDDILPGYVTDFLATR